MRRILLCLFLTFIAISASAQYGRNLRRDTVRVDKGVQYPDGTFQNTAYGNLGLTGIINVKEPPYNATGDGATNDLAAIQSAINVASLSGGTVFFPPGTYKTGGILRIDSSNVRLLGEGMASKIIADTNTIASILQVNRLRVGGDQTGLIRTNNVSIENLYFDHQGDNQLDEVGGVGGTIWINDVDNLLLNNLYLKDARSWGIRVGGCRYVKISNCMVDRLIPSAGGTGNAFDVTGFFNAPPVGPNLLPGGVIEIVNCIAKDAPVGFVGGSATCPRVTITNCQAIACVLGFYIEHGTYFNSDVTVTGCIADSCVDGIISSMSDPNSPFDPSGERFVFANNIVNGRSIPQSRGIAFEQRNITITGNVISGVKNGIGGTDSYNKIHVGNVAITGNQVTIDSTIGGQSGISITKDATGTTNFSSGYSISGNVLDGSSSLSGSGILVGGKLSQVSIQGNVVRNFGAGGIRVVKGTYLATPNWVTISGNNVSSCSWDYGAANGISVDSGGANISITGNLSTDVRTSPKQAYGLSVADSCKDVFAYNNFLIGNYNGSLYLGTGDRIWATQNYIDSAGISYTTRNIDTDSLHVGGASTANVLWTRNGKVRIGEVTGDADSTLSVYGSTLLTGGATINADNSYVAIRVQDGITAIKNRGGADKIIHLDVGKLQVRDTSGALSGHVWVDSLTAPVYVNLGPTTTGNLKNYWTGAVIDSFKVATDTLRWYIGGFEYISIKKP